ncbi:MAG TPA: DUF2723 domain-containing protein [Chloroflexi bacterium]|nr:DUF2723 domain-containing protein [Chloroflexota bacterium]
MKIHPLIPARWHMRWHTRTWIIVAVGIAALLYVSTCQTTVNGSLSPYATDVGEIQNALPRWGTIHWTGYPLYTFLGSTFVTLLCWIGIEPATGASLYSVVWGLVSVGLIVVLLQELDVPGPVAALGGLVAAVSTSMWMDASIAEVHTMTTAFTVATFLFALRFGRTGERRDLLWLAFAFSQGVIHQRAVLFLAPAVAVLVLRSDRWRAIGRGMLPALTISLLAPLTYLYLPWRVQQGTTWTFGTPGTWQGVIRMLFDNRAERIVTWPGSLAEWTARIWRAFEITAADLNVILLALGLLGLLVLALKTKRDVRTRWREPLALTLAWLPYLLLTAIIWIGRVGDAQLAAHLPVTVLAAVGLALLAAYLDRRWTWRYPGATLALAGVVVFLAARHRPQVLAVTRDPGAETIIATAAQITPPPDERPTTLMALWGNDYWALVYAQAYRGQFAELDVVDHNANFEAILERGHRLFTLSKTFYRRSVAWWEGRLGSIYLETYAPGLIEISPAPRTLDTVDKQAMDPEPFRVNDDLAIASVEVREEEESYRLTVHWLAKAVPERDYSVAVHLLAPNPGDVLDQADSLHPVEGWYPTTRWMAGQVVQDVYRLTPPSGGKRPGAIRITAYHVDEDGQFVNGEWFTVNLSP